MSNNLESGTPQNIASSGVRKELLHSVLVDGEKVTNMGQALDLSWKYLENELRGGGLIKENEIINQSNIHKDGIRFVIVPKPTIVTL